MDFSGGSFPLFGEDDDWLAQIQNMDMSELQGMPSLEDDHFGDAFHQTTQVSQTVDPALQPVSAPTQPLQIALPQPAAAPVQQPSWFYTGGMAQQDVPVTYPSPGVYTSASVGQGQPPYFQNTPHGQPGNAFKPSVPSNPYISGPSAPRAQQVLALPHQPVQANPFSGPQSNNSQTLYQGSSFPPQHLQPQNLNHETANPPKSPPRCNKHAPRFLAVPWAQKPDAQYHVRCEHCCQDLALTHDPRFPEPHISTKKDLPFSASTHEADLNGQQTHQPGRSKGSTRASPRLTARKRAAVDEEEPDEEEERRPKKRQRPPQDVVTRHAAGKVATNKVMSHREKNKLEREGFFESDNHPSKIYSGKVEVPKDWGPLEGGQPLFRYRETGHLEERTFSAAQIKTFILENPRDLTLWIQNFPAQSTWRFPGETPLRCLWECCPVSNGYIKAGWLTINFDEFPEQTTKGARDPFSMAALMHLWCFEHCFDMCAYSLRDYITADIRVLPKEGKNAMSLHRETNEGRIVQNCVQPWFMEHMLNPGDTPRQAPLDHKDSLSYALVSYHLQKQPRGRQELREKTSAANKMTIDVHRGDLMKFVDAKGCNSRTADEVLHGDNAFQVLSNEPRHPIAPEPVTQAPAPQPRFHEGFQPLEDYTYRYASSSDLNPQDSASVQSLHDEPMQPCTSAAPEAVMGPPVAQVSDPLAPLDDPLGFDLSALEQATYGDQDMLEDFDFTLGPWDYGGEQAVVAEPGEFQAMRVQAMEVQPAPVHFAPTQPALPPVQNDPADNMPQEHLIPPIQENDPTCIIVDTSHIPNFEEDQPNQAPSQPFVPPPHLLQRNVKVTSLSGYQEVQAEQAAKRKRDDDEQAAREAEARAKRQRVPQPTRSSPRNTRQSKPMVHLALPRRPSKPHDG